MARNGFPDEENNHSDGDPTQYGNYGGTPGQAYSEYGTSGWDQPPTGYPPQPGYGGYPAPEPPAPTWHHRPAVLIGLGVLTAALLALLFYAIVNFTNAGSSGTPAVTSTSTTATSSAPVTSEAPPPPGPASQSEAPSRSSEAPATVTTTVTPTTTAAPTTSEAPSPTTVTSVTTSVTTVTETTTKPLWPTFPKPTPRSPTLMEPPPGG